MWKVISRQNAIIRAFYIVRKQLFTSGSPLCQAHYMKEVMYVCT